MTEINTARLTLRPIGVEYLTSAYAYAGDVENTRLMMFMPFDSLDETRAYLARFDAQWQRDDPEACEFAILLGEEHIGEVGVDLYDGATVAELGWVLRADHQGKGYATEAARAVVDYARRRFGVRRFFARCDAENIQSQRVMHKLGMRCTDADGTRRNRGSDEIRRELTFEM